MTFEQYKKLFVREAEQQGYSEVNITKCLNYSEKLFQNKVPVIYNISHLSGLVGYRENYLKRAVLHTSFFYRNFYIPKRNGDKRRISEPLPSLKEIQLWILQNILYNVEISKFAKAYIPKHSIKNNVNFHSGQKIVASIDLKDFFPSIKVNKIESIFRSLGYSNYLSNLLAKICCFEDPVEHGLASLPQGAPTSPYLSNIYLKPLDEHVSKYCVERKIRYTRYADDLTFSGDFDFSELFSIVNTEVVKLGLKVNEKKTRILGRNNRQVVTGVVVNDKLQVERKKRKEIRQTIYYIRKFGLDNHMKKLNIRKAHYIEHLLGKINFVLFINKEDTEFLKYKEYLMQIKNHHSELN